MRDIPDFTDSELWCIRTTLEERYKQPVEPQLADAELRLDNGSPELTSCPTAYWERGGCNFAVMKTGNSLYRCQFYYRGYQMYGTGVPEFDNITECIVTLLQVQVDHESGQQEQSV